MGKSTISMAIFNSKLLVHQRVADLADWSALTLVEDHESPPVPVLTKARAVFAQNLFRVPSYERRGRNFQWCQCRVDYTNPGG